MLGERFPQQSLWPRLRLREGVGYGVAGELGCNRNWVFPAAQAQAWTPAAEAGGGGRSVWGGRPSSRPISCTLLSGRSPVGSRASGSVVSHVWGAQVQAPVSPGATESLGW